MVVVLSDGLPSLLSSRSPSTCVHTASPLPLLAIGSVSPFLTSEHAAAYDVAASLPSLFLFLLTDGPCSTLTSSSSHANLSHFSLLSVSFSIATAAVASSTVSPHCHWHFLHLYFLTTSIATAFLSSLPVLHRTSPSAWLFFIAIVANHPPFIAIAILSLSSTDDLSVSSPSALIPRPPAFVAECRPAFPSLLAITTSTASLFLFSNAAATASLFLPTALIFFNNQKQRFCSPDDMEVDESILRSDQPHEE